MKSVIIVFLCSVAAAVFGAEQVLFKIPPQSLDKLHKIALPCAQQNNIDTSVIRKLGDPTFPRDEASNKFLYCYALNSGFVREDGQIVVERIAGVLGNHPLKEEVKAVLKKCNESIKENPIATAVAMQACYAEKSPVLFSF